MSKVSKGRKDQKGHKVSKANKGHKGHKANKGHKGRKANKSHKGRKVLQEKEKADKRLKSPTRLRSIRLPLSTSATTSATTGIRIGRPTAAGSPSFPSATAMRRFT